MKEKKVTIREVAELAGVSISSVSRYLADPKSIQPLAAYNIKNAINELQYEPNMFARNLKRGQTQIVGLIVPHMEYFFGKICHVVSDYFFERKYITYICESDSEREKELFYVQELLNQRAAGIIIAPSGQNTPYLQGVTKNYKNMIAIDRQEDIGCDMVLENHRDNAYHLISWLLKNKPCSRIMMLFGWSDSFNTRMCLAGANQALEEAGRDGSRVIKIFTARKIEVVMDALKQLNSVLEDGERPVIIGFGTDIVEYIAMGIHQLYPEWIGNVDIAGFAMGGTKEKLGMDCSLVVTPGLYAVLAERGFFPKEDLEPLRHIGSHLQGHPNMNDTPGVDMSTGSLGQGISAAVGMAVAAKHWGDTYRTYALLGDGESEEGQVWEAAMFAGNQQLDNLCVIVDHNGLQIDGPVEEVNDPMPLADKFRAFKFHVVELADGNDFDQIRAAFAEARATKGQPTAIIAETTKGKGVSFMENQVGWHGKAPNDEQFEQAMAELTAAGEEL